MPAATNWLVVLICEKHICTWRISSGEVCGVKNELLRSSATAPGARASHRSTGLCCELRAPPPSSMSLSAIWCYPSSPTSRWKCYQWQQCSQDGAEADVCASILLSKEAWCDHLVQIRPRLVAHFPTPRAGRWHCWPLEGAESEPGWTETASWSQFGSCVFTWRMVSTESSQSCMSKQQWWCCHQPCPSSEAACCSSKAGALTASVGILMPVLKPVHFSQITCMQTKRSLWSASECLLPPRRCLVMVRSDKFHLFYLDATQWEKQVWVLNTLEDRLESKGR